MKKKIKYLLDYFRYLDNPIHALMFKFGLIKSGKIIIKKNEVILNNISSLNMLMDKIKLIPENRLENYLKYIEQIDNEDMYILIDNIKFININTPEFIKHHKYHIVAHLDEFYTDDSLHIINYSNRHVIDLGGNIGDTALFFANEGADVISFEPVKHLYDIAVKNVELNPKLKNKITLVNKGVGGKRGKLEFDSPMIESYRDSDSTEMEIITLSDLLEDYTFTPDILKMDCEGCEYEIILKNDLSIFNEIIFEHHSKIANYDYNILVDELRKQGFKIKFIDSIAEPLEMGWTFEDIGMIYAYK